MREGYEDTREHITKVNISNIVFPNQNIDTELPHSSIDHVIVPDTIKITFDIDIMLTDKTRSIVNNNGRVLAVKRC